MIRSGPALGLLGLLACAPDDGDRSPRSPDAPDDPFEAGGEVEASEHAYNILWVIVDDLGIDKVAAYGAHPTPARTPNIDALAQEGVLFRNAWVYPTCSPTRAAFMAGQHPRKWGIGDWIWPTEHDVELPREEVTIPEALRASRPEYANAMLGKWHLTNYRDLDAAVHHPNDQGWDHYSGSLANPQEMLRPDPRVVRDYFHWEKVTDGEVAWSDTYMTTDTTNDAIEQMQTLPEPWFLTVSFNAPHSPAHVPPWSLITQPVFPSSTNLDKHDAVVEALDTELGRMLASMDAGLRSRTVIVFVSDNGTEAYGIRAPMPPGHSKGTVFEGGVNVPLIVVGPVVDRPGSESLALVHAVDFFPTVLELAGADYDDGVERPGTSFLPYVRDPDRPSTRERLVTERFAPNGPGPYDRQMRAIRSADFKYAWADGVEAFFEMVAPFDEGPAIPADARTPDQWQQFDELKAELAEFLDENPAPYEQ